MRGQVLCHPSWNVGCSNDSRTDIATKAQLFLQLGEKTGALPECQQQVMVAFHGAGRSLCDVVKEIVTTITNSRVELAHAKKMTGPQAAPWTKEQPRLQACNAQPMFEQKWVRKD